MDAFDLILASATPHYDNTARLTIARLAGEVSNWDRILELACASRSMPILHQRLAAAAADRVPPSILTQLERAHLANAARTTAMTRGLADAMQALKDAGIPALTYKGPTLAQLAYEDPGVRQYDDLDILVPAKHLGEARSVLERRGYTEILELPAHVAASTLRSSTSHILRHRDGTHDIDLSSGLLHDYFSFRIPPADLWRSALMVDLDGRSLPTFPIGILLLYLCVHGSKHLWVRPTWVADVAGLLFRQEKNIDWRTVRRMALESDGVRMLQLGVELAARVYNVTIPPDAAPWLAPSHPVSVLADRIMTRQRACAGQPEQDDWERVRFHLALRQRVRSRLRYLLVRSLAPSPNDWRSLRLPPSLWPLYIPYRLGRLTLRGLRHLTRRSTP